MKLTDGQFKWLKWFADKGGVGRIEGQHIYIGSGERSTLGAQVTFLHLVAKGLIAGNDGFLTLTEKGRRHVTP